MSEIPAEPEDQLLTPAPGVDQERAAAAIRELLVAVGEDPDRPDDEADADDDME